MTWLRWKYAPIAAILALAFALRLVAIETRPLWYDDAFSVLLAERGPAAIARGTAADTMPPGYYLMLYGWMSVMGQTPLAMRMLSVALAMLVVALTYAVAKRGFGAGAGNWAALLVALMPFQIYHAQELRMYTLLALGGLIYVYGVLVLALPTNGIRPSNGAEPDASHNRGKAITFIAVGTALALYAHNLAFVTLLAGNIYLVLRAAVYRQAWRMQGELIAGQLLGTILFVPWLFYVPTQLEKIQTAFWTQTPGLVDAVQMALVFTTYLPLPPSLIVFALIVSMLVLIFACWQLVRLARKKRMPALGLVSAFLVIPPLILFALSYLIRPVFVPRAVIVSALVYAMLLGMLVSRAPRKLQIGLGVVAFGLAAALLPFYYSAFGEWRRAPYVGADAFLRAQVMNGDAVVHDNKLSFFPMHLYDRALAQVFLADPPQSDNDTLAPASQEAMELFPTEFRAAVAGRERVWFVIYRTAIQEAQAAGKPHGNLARLDGQFERVQETNYGDLVIVLYTAR